MAIVFPWKLGAQIWAGLFCLFSPSTVSHGFLLVAITSTSPYFRNALDLRTCILKPRVALYRVCWSILVIITSIRFSPLASLGLILGEFLFPKPNLAHGPA